MLWLTATFICAVSMLPLRVGSLHVPMTWNSSRRAVFCFLREPGFPQSRWKSGSPAHHQPLHALLQSLGGEVVHVEDLGQLPVGLAPVVRPDRHGLRVEPDEVGIVAPQPLQPGKAGVSIGPLLPVVPGFPELVGAHGSVPYDDDLVAGVVVLQQPLRGDHTVPPQSRMGVNL